MPEYVDKDGISISSDYYYHVYPYSSPHILAGFTKDMAVFENYERSKDVLDREEVAARVRIYTIEECDKFSAHILGFANVEEHAETWRKIMGMHSNFVDFLKRSGKKFKPASEVPGYKSEKNPN